jgi:hypothetical protein
VFAQHEPLDYDTKEVVMVKVKRFVSTVLLFTLVMIVPLETLSQLEPEVTYRDWCGHLAELHAEREARATVNPASTFWSILLGTTALLAGAGFFDMASFEDYLANEYWFHISKADEYRAVGSLLLAVGCVIWILYFADVGRRARETKALYGERSYADVLREIELWAQAGTGRMWFYPCE